MPYDLTDYGETAFRDTIGIIPQLPTAREEEWTVDKMKEIETHQVEFMQWEALENNCQCWLSMLFTKPHPIFGPLTAYLGLHISHMVGDKLGYIFLDHTKTSNSIPNSAWETIRKGDTLEHKGTSTRMFDVEVPEEIKQFFVSNPKKATQFTTFMALSFMRAGYGSKEKLIDRGSNNGYTNILTAGTKFYGIVPPFTSTYPTTESINAISTTCPTQSRVLNTIIVACLKASASSSDIKGILDFAILLRTTYTGMHMYNYFCNIVRIYRVKIHDLLDLLATTVYKESVDALHYVVIHYEGMERMDNPPKDVTHWRSARALSDKFFARVKTSSHRELTFLLATLIYFKDTTQVPTNVTVLSTLGSQEQEYLRGEAEKISEAMKALKVLEVSSSRFSKLVNDRQEILAEGHQLTTRPPQKLKFSAPR
jgi:hypothetical protein